MVSFFFKGCLVRYKTLKTSPECTNAQSTHPWTQRSNVKFGDTPRSRSFVTKTVITSALTFKTRTMPSSDHLYKSDDQTGSQVTDVIMYETQDLMNSSLMFILFILHLPSNPYSKKKSCQLQWRICWESIAGDRMWNLYRGHREFYSEVVRRLKYFYPLEMLRLWYKRYVHCFLVYIWNYLFC